MALTQALDLGELAEGAHLRARARPATDAGAPSSRVACPGDSRLRPRRARAPGRSTRRPKAGPTASAPRPEAALTFLYDSARGQRRRRGRRARRAAVGGRSASGHGQGRRTTTALQQTDLRHRRLGHRLGAAQREQPRPAGARSSPARPAPDGTNFSGIDNADYDAGVAEGRRHDRHRTAAPTWLGAESALFNAADIVPFANNAGADLRQRRRVRVPGPARADQHPDARRS